MESAFARLGLGLVFASVLVYLLMVVNFQSWLDPFIIITALPGAFIGIVWSLFLWQTTFSVPALMGAIMSIGVATANSILLVTFANEQRGEGKSAFEAALEAGRTRMRRRAPGLRCTRPTPGTNRRTSCGGGRGT